MPATKKKSNKKWQTKRIRYGGRSFNVPVIPGIYGRILRFISRKNVTFDMDVVLEESECGTVCCIAGAVQHIAGAQFRFIIAPAFKAEQMILAASADLPVPGFTPFDYDDGAGTTPTQINARARAKIRELAKLEREL
jgi:hypothetical protein